MSDNNATADANDSRPNSSCPVCPQDQCLCEVKIDDKGGKVTYYLKSSEEIKQKGKERLSNRLIFLSPAKFDYKVTGECEYSPNEALDKCVAVYDYEFSEIVDEQNSYSGEEYHSHYDPLIENKISKYSKGFNFISMEQNDYSIEYEDVSKVYISIGEEQKIEYFMKKPTGLVEGEAFDFIRGINFLVLGKITYFPVNVHRLGVMICDPDSYKGQAVVTEHYTDMFVLPEYEVSFEGGWDFGNEDPSKGQSFEISYEEKVDGKTTREIELSYQQVKKELAPNNQGENKSTDEGFLTSVFKLIDSFGRMGLIQKTDESWKDMTLAEKTKEMLERRDLDPQKLKHRIFPPLYRVGLLPPGLKVAAKAKLTNKDGKLLHINRTLDTPPDDPNIDNPKPISPDGMYNQPNCIMHQSEKDVMREEIPKEITEGEGYLHLDPLIAGYISVNFIAMLTRVPKIGAVLGAVNAILDFDMFAKLTGAELKFDSSKERKKRLEESNGRAIQTKAFCFLTLDAEASILLKFYDESIDQDGTNLEVRGSIGAGFALGAAVGVDLWVFQANASAETTYGARFHFSFNIVTEEIRIWHDQIGLEAEGSITTGGSKSTTETKGGKGGFEGSYQSGKRTASKDEKGVSVEYDIIGGSYKQKVKEGSWLAAKTYEDTPWVYQFGEDIKDQVEDDSPKGKFLSNLKLVVQFLYDHEGNNANFLDFELRKQIEPRLQEAIDKEINNLKGWDETLTQEDEAYIISIVFTELSAWHEATYSRLGMPGYNQYYGTVRNSIIRIGRARGMSMGFSAGTPVFK